MGTGEKEPAKVILLPYLQRADELQKHDPLVAYYCRLYGMERGLKVPSKERSKTMNALLISLMNQLEKDKRTVKLSADDNLHVEGFALNVFSKADKQDRAGRADLNTAKTFYAASIFFEILNQFGELQPEIEQKQKYAVWKAADIRKALSEGRKSEPGPPGGDAGFALDDVLTEEVVSSTETSGNVSPPFQDQHVVHGNYSSGYYASTAPPPVDHPPTAPAPDNMNFQPSYGSHPDSQYQSSSETEHWNEYPKEANNYPKGSTNDYPNMPFGSNYQVSHDQQASSAYYPSSSLPPAAGADYHTPPAYPCFNNNSSSSSSSSTVSVQPGSQQYPSAPAAYESPVARKPQFDSDYKPSPEKVTEAHKASRFAVSALAFDDVPTAISYLRRSLELLTSPSAS